MYTLIKHKSKLSAFIFLLLLPSFCHAVLFRNSYISFELPPNWSCRLVSTEYVCHSKFTDKSSKFKHKHKSKEAVIILTAKEVGPMDTMAAYQAYLKTPKLIPNKSGTSVRSKVLHVRQRKISNQDWVDSMHLGSEISTYYTRYLATIKNKIAILVTFSAHKLHYTKYSNDFLKAIQSLKVTATKGLLSKNSVDIRRSNETIGAPIGSAIPSDMMSEEYPQEPSGNGGLINKLFGLALLLGAIGFYFYRKNKNK